MDSFSSLPDNVISLILEKLPFKDRVKTSSLSRNWRLKWTFLPSLELEDIFHSRVLRSRRPPLECANIANSLLSQHGGGLKEFSLSLPYDDQASSSLFQTLVSYVMQSSRSSMEVLYLGGIHIQEPFAMTYSIFFVSNLRHLTISVNKLLKFNPPAWFEGFPNLTHFELMGSRGQRPTFGANAISHFVSVCPRMEEIALVNMKFVGQNLDLKAPNLSHLRVDGDCINISIPNPQNLKMISISFDNLDRADTIKWGDMLKIFVNSLQLRDISLGGLSFEALGKCSDIDALPRFDQVEHLLLRRLNLDDPSELKCFLSFCAASRNVESLQVVVNSNLMDERLELEAMCEKYISDDLGKLVSISLLNFTLRKVEMKMIELLLRFSPVLEEMDIYLTGKSDDDYMWERQQSQVRNFYRASPNAKICIA